VLHGRQQTPAVLLAELSAQRHLVLVPVHALRGANRGAPFGFTEQKHIVGLHAEINLGTTWY
jgi:hypothetical protein